MQIKSVKGDLLPRLSSVEVIMASSAAHNIGMFETAEPCNLCLRAKDAEPCEYREVARETGECSNFSINSHMLQEVASSW